MAQSRKANRQLAGRMASAAAILREVPFPTRTRLLRVLTPGPGDAADASLMQQHAVAMKVVQWLSVVRIMSREQDFTIPSQRFRAA